MSGIPEFGLIAFLQFVLVAVVVNKLCDKTEKTIIYGVIFAFLVLFAFVNG